MNRRALSPRRSLGAALALFLSLGFFAQARAEDSPDGRTALRLGGGLGLMNGGDLSRGFRGWLGLWEQLGSRWGVETDLADGGSLWGPALSADVLFPLTSWLSFGMGAGRETAGVVFRSSAEGNGGLVPESQRIEISSEAVPVRAGFFGRIRLTDVLDLSLHAGASYYYLARARVVYRREWEDYWEEDRYDLKASGLGYDGGLGVELKLGRHLSVYLEGRASRAALGEFTGTVGISSSEGGEASREGTLYVLDYGLGEGRTFTLVDVLSQPPSGPAFSRAEEAAVDFGGFSLAAGILLRL